MGRPLSGPRDHRGSGDPGIPLDGAADHGGELYWDRSQEQWPRGDDGGLAMFTHRLDLESLLAEAPL